MVFGKIDYLNLLPFYIYLQKSFPEVRYFRDGVPSEINRDFYKRRVDFAFISSIKSKKSRCSNLGIIARDEVLSVRVLNEKGLKKDSASETSNRLAEILKIDGEVIIGDRALKHYFDYGTGIDLAKEWQKRYHLPFVFAKLCFHRNSRVVKKIERGFKKSRVSIPQYILRRVSKEVGVSTQNILLYLKKIDYYCDSYSKKGLQKFLSFR